MKIFLSHSSKQKLFVREIQSQLPNFIEYWIDEKDMRLGDSLESAIKSGITDASDFFLLFLDAASARSVWVRQELMWAIECEEKNASPTLIICVIDEEALDLIDFVDLRTRKYIQCYDFSEESIRAVSGAISEELFAITAKKAFNQSKQSPTNASDLLDAEKTFSNYGKAFRDAIFGYRRQNPISIQELRLKVNTALGTSFESDADLVTTLEKLRNMGLLKGYFFDSEIAFLANERVAHKIDLNVETKRAIAQKALRYVENDMTIGLDGGSTVLEFVVELCKLIESRAVDGLRILTTSLPAAEAIMSCLNQMNSGDKDSTCSVFLIGGWCRPISLTTIPLGEAELEETLRIAGFEGSVDLALLGANGINGLDGFANNNQQQMLIKRYLHDHAKQALILLESRKFGVQQKNVFAPFSKNISVITNELSEHRDIYDKISSLGVNMIFCEK